MFWSRGLALTSQTVTRKFIYPFSKNKNASLHEITKLKTHLIKMVDDSGRQDSKVATAAATATATGNATKSTSLAAVAAAAQQSTTTNTDEMNGIENNNNENDDDDDDKNNDENEEKNEEDHDDEWTPLMGEDLAMKVCTFCSLCAVLKRNLCPLVTRHVVLKEECSGNLAKGHTFFPRTTFVCSHRLFKIAAPFGVYILSRQFVIVIINKIMTMMIMMVLMQ